MLIRSQDKKMLMPIMPLGITSILRCTIREIDKVEGYVIYAMNNANTTLGTYSTEEKAIKVLDMICDTCRNIAFIDEKAVVFQMPQDSEV